MVSKLKDFYYSKWCPRFFFKKYDGGKESGVTGYFLIEWKLLFSIGILRFSKGSRENFHSHAFNTFTWWLKGKVTEIKLSGEEKVFTPSFNWKFTSRDNNHKVFAHETTYALTFRGPWEDVWKEFSGDGSKVTLLTHGRKVVA